MTYRVKLVIFVSRGHYEYRITRELRIVTDSFKVLTAHVDCITLLHIAIPVATNRLLSSKISRGGGAIMALPIASGARLACC
jgi:hypothetical protein